MTLRKVLKLFEEHSVAVTGMKGSGKDLLFGNVIVRRKLPYAGNIDYTQDERYIPLNLLDLNVLNTYANFISGHIRRYVCPYPERCDVYLSDCGIILPSQYCNELNKSYQWLASFAALSRHLNNSKLHYNCQSLNRVYDKVREQCDAYIYCRRCIYIKGINLVFQEVTFYDKAESCQARINPCRVPAPKGLFPDRNAQAQIDIYKDNFFNTHGSVKTRWLIYFNRAKYDTRHFKKLLEGGV